MFAKGLLKVEENRGIPFDKVVEVVRPHRDLSRITVISDPGGLERSSSSDAIHRFGRTDRVLCQCASSAAKYDLSLFLTDADDEIWLEVEYCTDLFDEGTIQRLLGHYQQLLQGIVANPMQPINQLPLLTEPERHQLVVEWNDTARTYPTEPCLHELFEEQAERTPTAVAVVYGDQQLTYRELNTRANRLAHSLRDLGVGPETLVGICVERSVELVVGLLGILKAGGAYVPLDPEYPAERLAFMVADSDVARDLDGAAPSASAIGLGGSCDLPGPGRELVARDFR